jgi:hypothetical protein
VYIYIYIYIHTGKGCSAIKALMVINQNKIARFGHTRAFTAGYVNNLKSKTHIYTISIHTCPSDKHIFIYVYIYY